jgi:hypothetical protein
LPSFRNWTFWIYLGNLNGIMQLKENQLVLSASDLANHLGCQHLTQLSRKVAHAELTRVFRRDPLLEALIERGEQHERDYLEHLKLQGMSVFEVSGDKDNGTGKTLQAMREGYDVIVQAKLKNDGWLRGLAVQG